MRGFMPAALAALIGAAALPALPISPAEAASGQIPFEEIDRGEISSYLYNTPDFTGAEMHITDQRAWEAFWSHHTRGITPAPPLPRVRFGREDVIVVLLGTQTTGGGPSIGIRGMKRTGRGQVTIEILEDRTPGPLTVISNPYQIVRTPKLRGTVTFLHIEAGRRLCQTHEDCPEDHLCSLADPTCRSPVTGRCAYHPPGSGCPTVWMPACGCDGVTYANACFVELDGAVLKHLGECR